MSSGRAVAWMLIVIGPIVSIGGALWVWLGFWLLKQTR
jgi:hypothetical protein